MFEQYSVPSLTYSIDSVMSFYHNNLPTPPTPFTTDGLVISFNTASTSVIPILSGRGILSHAKRYVSLLILRTLFKRLDLQRISWGASQASDYLLKRIQLKYPTFPSRITQTHSTVSHLNSLQSISFLIHRSGCSTTYVNSQRTIWRSYAS